MTIQAKGVVFGAAAVLAILVVAWLASRRTDADPVLRDEPVAGVVRSVAADGGTWSCEVELASGARVQVACGTPAPREGERLALRALHHRSGAVSYFAPRASSGL
jgi:hypothetical protein